MVIQYIFHISDIHIMEKNYNNINHSFAVLINAIKTQGIDSSLLVIAGDIFESKSYLNTDDIYQWKLMCLILKKENIKTLIMCGNHDYNINSELVRDNVSLLTISCDNIICVNKTGIVNGSEFGDANLEFYIFSPIDKQIPIITDNSCIKIAMLHEPVNHAIYDNGESISDGRFTADDLVSFNYVLLGDIHLTQFLTPRIAYCGSFVQKTKGEGISKGYILWNLQSGLGMFVEIPLKELYIKIEAVNNQCELPVVKKNQVVRHTSLIYTDCTLEYITDLKKIINDKYKYINRIVNNTKLVVNKDKINTIDSGAGYQLGHEIIIKEILKDNALMPKILTHHLNILRNRSETTFTTYKLNYLYFSNVFCYGENNYINFNEFNNNLVMLNGKNKEGKSSIIDIIIRVLFNECERGFKEDIVNKSKTKGFIKIGFTIGTDIYTIEQVFLRSKSQQHRLYKNGENITCDTILNTYKFLREKVGLGDYKDFVNMTTAMQNRKFLVDMAQKDFVSLLTKITNIDILKDVEDETKKRISVLKSINKKIDSDILRIPDVTLLEVTELKTTATELEKIRDSALLHINTINARLIEANRDFNNIKIPNNLEQVIKTNLTKLDKFGKFTTNLTLADVQHKHWSLTKVLNAVNPQTLSEIITNDYSNLPVINPASLINKIKSLVEITYKPKQEFTRTIDQLQIIINNPCLTTLEPVVKCETNAVIALDAAGENEQLIQSGLPNYEQIKSEFLVIKTKIEQFNNNFGTLTFNNACASCCDNTTNIKKIFNITSESKKLVELKDIYDQRKTNKIKLANAILYKKNLMENAIFTSNQIIIVSNNLITLKITEYNAAVVEMREAVNKENWQLLQQLEQQLTLIKEQEIQNAAIELRDIDMVKNYLLLTQEYKTLESLAAIKLSNATSLTSIEKLNKLSVVNNGKLNDANRKLLEVLEIYRIKQNDYSNKTALVKAHGENLAELDFNELYLRVVNCKTGIPSFVLKDTCMRVQNNCNKILQTISDFTMYIEYDKEIKIYTIENDIKIPASMSSGMQKFIIDLIFRITLTEISSISNPRMLFVDEGFGSLDRDNFIAVAKILQKLKVNFDSLIIISHITELRNFCDLSINITRKNYLSNVQYGILTNDQTTLNIISENLTNDNNVIEYKEKIKKEKTIKKISSDLDNNKSVELYLAEHGGMESLLFTIEDADIYCKGCQKQFTLKKNFAARHASSETHKKKHYNFVLTLI